MPMQLPKPKYLKNCENRCAVGCPSDYGHIDRSLWSREEMGATRMQNSFAIVHTKSSKIIILGIVIVKTQKKN